MALNGFLAGQIGHNLAFLMLLFGSVDEHVQFGSVEKATIIDYMRQQKKKTK